MLFTETCDLRSSLIIVLLEETSCGILGYTQRSPESRTLPLVDGVGIKFVAMKQGEVGGMKARKRADDKRRRNFSGAANRGVILGHDVMLRFTVGV